MEEKLTWAGVARLGSFKNDNSRSGRVNLKQERFSITDEPCAGRPVKASNTKLWEKWGKLNWNSRYHGQYHL
ncbi:hypothetical protein EVAR_25112_1 [Eumeta japonica]|uniref:Uncharacterized protein n=1 Tax=Eumeta variegata TaxID=151549 RepID=A0A4C1XJL5_EUMVA|nr:hypothetical protein EVAR_25112_1 [Eumeta japonica]